MSNILKTCLCCGGDSDPEYWPTNDFCSMECVFNWEDKNVHHERLTWEKVDKELQDYDR